MRGTDHGGAKLHENAKDEDREEAGNQPRHPSFTHFALRGLRHLRRLRDPNSHHHILRAMLDGATLKAHRTLDGEKIHMLHPLDGPDEIVDSSAVAHLKQHALIRSNMKFPAATYVLTGEGRALAQSLP